MSWHEGYGPGPDEMIHLPRLDEDGNPTDYALCDEGDGSFPGGELAVPNAWRANCPACERWSDDGTQPAWEVAQ